jgi:hypothetical protein
VFTFATTKHDSTYKLNVKLGTLEPAQGPLTTTIEDVNLIRDLFEKFSQNIEIKEHNGVSFDLVNPTWNECMKVQKALKALLKDAGEERIAIVYTFASHGGMRGGLQTVIVDQFDKKTRYFKLWQVEAMIRDLARIFVRSFHFVIFACCREVLEKTADCYEGPYDKAFAKYQEDVKAIEMAKLQAQTDEDAIRQAKAIIKANEESKSDDEADKAEDANTESKVAQRGDTSHLPPVKRDNTVLLFGARGGSGVNANTAMCREIADILMRYDRHSLQSFIPTAFEMFSGQDASFEMIVSSTAQVCALDFTGDIVERLVAVIFLTTELLGYSEYKAAKERADLYKEFLVNVVGFDVVEICLNFTRA